MTSWIDKLPDAHIRFRIKRVPTEKFISGKRYLTNEETKQLFNGPVIITEKCDGKQMTKLFADNIVIGGEYMKHTHSIDYTKIPKSSGWFILWGVYSLDHKMFYSYDWEVKIANEYGFTMAPLIFSGQTDLEETLKFLDRKSSFGDETQEGIVIKNYANQVKGLPFVGKIVRHEFVAGIELKGHYLRAKGEAKMNSMS